MKPCDMTCVLCESGCGVRDEEKRVVSENENPADA